MKQEIIEWLLEDTNPEVKLRVLKEGLRLDDNHSEVIKTKEKLMKSKQYESAIHKLQSDKRWSVYDGILAFAEWGLTRTDLGETLDNAVFQLIEQNGFQMLCGEPLLLRNLIKLGYYKNDMIRQEIEETLNLVKSDGGYACISKNKKINDPKRDHKSCARLTACYLLLAAELKNHNLECSCSEQLLNYYQKRNIFYRTDDMSTAMVDVTMETFFPADPIKVGVQYLVYALHLLGCDSSSSAMTEGYRVLDQYLLADGTYILSKSKSNPAFKPGKLGKANKWITFYGYMAKGTFNKLQNEDILLDNMYSK